MATVRADRVDESATPPPRPSGSSSPPSRLKLAVAAHVAERVLGLVCLVVGARLASDSAYDVLRRWDARWYARIAEHGYGHVHVAADGRHLADYAFFPLYPVLERVLAELTGLSVLDAGLAISLVASVVAAAGIYRVGAQLHDARTGVVLACLWSTVPVAGVTSMAYTESLFTALAAWSLSAMLSRRLVVAAGLAALAGLTRPLGVAVVAAVVVAAAAVVVERRVTRARAPAAGRTPLGMPLLATAVAPLGLIGYLAFVRWDSGGELSYFQVTGGWGNHLDGGRAFAAWVWDLTVDQPLLGALVVTGLVLLVAAVWHTRHYPWPVVVFTVVAVLVSVSTSSYFGSRPRYLLPVFTLLLWPSSLLVRLRTRTLVLVLVVLAVASGVYGAFWLLGPGPP